MLIRMLVGLCGPTLTLSPGDEYEPDDAEAKRLIAAGFAVPVIEKKIERAVKKPIKEKRAK